MVLPRCNYHYLNEVFLEGLNQYPNATKLYIYMIHEVFCFFRRRKFLVRKLCNGHLKQHLTKKQFIN